MLDLPRITLICIAGYHDLHEIALRETLRLIKPAAVLAYGNRALDFTLAPETIQTRLASADDVAHVIFHDAPNRVQTTHALSLDWDGYVVTPDAWDDAFLEYDYIGAVWPWFTDRVVGNSGFCLRSKRLMDILRIDPHIKIKQPEDIDICRNWRSYLELQHGIRFAPEDVADRFSVEHGPIGGKTFGFHGIWNLFDHRDDTEIRARLMRMSNDQWMKPQIETLMYRALCMGRRELYRWIIGYRAQRLAGAKV